MISMEKDTIITNKILKKDLTDFLNKKRREDVQDLEEMNLILKILLQQETLNKVLYQKNRIFLKE